MRTRCAERVDPLPLRPRVLQRQLPAGLGPERRAAWRPRGDVDPGELASDAELLHSDAGHAHRRVESPDDGVGRRVRAVPHGAWAGGRAARRSWPTAGEGERDDRRRPRSTRSHRETSGLPRGDRARASPGPTREEVVRCCSTQDVLWSEVGSAAALRRARGRAAASSARPTSTRTGGPPRSRTSRRSPDIRGRGLASAVVLRAVEEAVASGHDFVFLIADDEDWPKELYARLGFEADRPHLELPQEARARRQGLH